MNFLICLFAGSGKKFVWNDFQVENYGSSDKNKLILKIMDKDSL
jgi:hypothetical protein